MSAHFTDRYNIIDSKTPLLNYVNTKKDVFTATSEQLQSIVEHPSLLSQLGGVDGISRSLCVDLNTGLMSDESFDTNYGVTALKKEQGDDDFSFMERKHIFGKNSIPEAPSKSLLQLIWTAYNDQTLVMLSIAAIISLAVDIWEDKSSSHPIDEPKVGWVDGIAIIIAVLVVVITSSINDFKKEKQFQKLNAKKEDRLVKVLRNGIRQQVHIKDLVVGDVMLLEPGDTLNVDCLYIEGYNLHCHESATTGEPKVSKKRENDCIILSGSKVTQGVAKVIVIAVGINSSYGKATVLMCNSKDEITPLQLKLNTLADQIAFFGFIAAGVMLLALVLKMLIVTYLNHQWIPTSDLLSQLVGIVIQAITVIVVAVPEGLPMAVTLALAFATTEMLKDNNLVRHLSACETMGNATTVCSDKTGTLTQNKMTVICASIAEEQFYTSAQHSKMQLKNSINLTTMSLVVEKICVNSRAFEGKNAEGQISLIGSTTECALIDFITKLGFSYKQQRISSQCVNMYPFDSILKSMTTVIQVNNCNANSPSRSHYRVYNKDAPETIIEACTHYMDKNGKVQLLYECIRSHQESIVSDYAKRSLRTLALAYCDIDNNNGNIVTRSLM